MKPKNLKCPFTWENRQPMIHDRVLYVPEYYQKHGEYAFPGWESPDVFGRSAPIEIEYCSGNGDWIVQKALNVPGHNWVAVEMQFDRVRKIWSKIQNIGIKNLLVVCGEALTFTRHYVSDSVFSAAYINFPDPWPKERHAKNRLLQEPFLTELARVLRKGSMLTLVTDHCDYAQAAIKAIQKNPSWKSIYDEPFYVHELPGYGSSYFDALWREKGLPIHYLQYLKSAQT